MNNTRQIAVVMFSDVVGYTAMMGNNEAAALSKLHAVQAIQKNLIASFSGTFVKEIGDGLLAYFSTADNAISCCHKIQKKIHTESELKVRIGLNQAEIIIEDGDIFGDGVNIASRIEALADPGGIYFSEQVTVSLPESFKQRCMPMGMAKLKNVKSPVMIYALQGDALTPPSKRRFQLIANPKKKLALIPALLVFLAVLGGVTFITIKYFRTQAAEEEARNSLDEIEQLVQSSWRDYSDAYDKAKALQQIIPDDPRLKRLIKESSVKVNVNTDPEGAEVFVKKYNSPNAAWQSIGITPIDSAELPIAILRWKVEKEGYQTVLAVDTDFEFQDISNMTKSNIVAPNDFYRKLDSSDSLPVGMARVIGSTMPYGKLEDFFVDINEVTNKQYKQFMDVKPYTNEKFWSDPFILNGEKIPWNEAMKLFKDKTGQPGPSTWMNGTYPEGQDDFPVSGVSWYEALAYAKFVKKDLPTGDHWGLARGDNTFVIRWPQVGGFALLAPFSNFNHNGPVRVGLLNGVTAWGAYDMAGNVREWCKNDTQLGKLIRGGSWNSNSYEFIRPAQAPAFDRSETNGFRCVRYKDGKPMPNVVYRITDVLGTEIFPPTLVDPVPDHVFKIYKSLFDYDQTEVKSKLVTRNDKHPAWIHEKVVYRAPYNDEEIIAHLFLPKNAQPPYQTIIYGPGSASFFQTNSDAIEKYYEYPIFLEYIVRSGRAVLFPICKGIFERQTQGKGYVLHLGADTHEYTEFMTQVIKDYRKSIDYLRTRGDIDANNIAFYGMSWGPFIGTILSCVEPRIKTNVFVSGGLRPQGRPEVNPLNFVGRITIPTLMLNGRYDSVLPLDAYIRPMYESLSTPKKDKKLVLFDTDHIPPQDGLTSETLAWFDRYMGKVNAIAAQ